MPALDHFGLLAPLYDRVIRTPDTRRLVHLAGLPTSGRLLDAGGGTGRIAQAMAGLARQVVVADESWKMLARTQGKPGMSAAASHAERLPFPDGAFDRVIMVDAYHHLADQSASLAELLRMCGPGGRLVIEEPDITRPGVWAIAVFERLALMRSRFRRAETIAGELQELGASVAVYRQQATAWVVADKRPAAGDPASTATHTPHAAP